MDRKLKKKELMVISRILERIDFKRYAEYLLSTKIDKIMKVYKDGKGQNDENKDSKFKLNEDGKAKVIVLVGDLFAFIIQNIHKVEDDIDELIRMYKGYTQNQVEDLEIDEYLSILKVIFLAGVPKVMSNFIDIENVKKNMKAI